MKQIELSYRKKRSPDEILSATEPLHSGAIDGIGQSKSNLLLAGDNLGVMQGLLQHFQMRSKIDMVYIDPPFSTNVIYRHGPTRSSTVSARGSDRIAYSDKLQGADFIEFIRERLIFIRELMADHASIYLHIDYKIGHYVKIVMDEIFGVSNFRNDITRIKCNPKNFRRHGYGNIKDMILFYTKTDKFTWNEPREPLTDEEIKRLFRKIDANGRKFTTTPLHAPGETQNGNTGKPWRGIIPPPGRHWRYDPKVLEQLDKDGLIEWSKTGNPRKIIYADDAKKNGKRVQDIWEFKDPQYPRYPTEKNIDMLKMLIETSSNPGDTVLDCFCGSGATLLAAQELGRNWIGIDCSNAAIEIAGKRLASNEPMFQDVTLQGTS